jgi:hypothetical protein
MLQTVKQMHTVVCYQSLRNGFSLCNFNANNFLLLINTEHIFLTIKLSYLNMCFKSLLGLKRGVAMQAMENQGSGM